VGGLAWHALDDPRTSVYVPLYAGITRVPESYQVGGRDKFERSSAFWAFNLVANWAELKYSYMIQDIRAEGDAFEDEFFARQAEIEARAVELLETDPEQARKYLTEYSNASAERTVKAWWELSELLITKYNDGYINLPETGQPVGYPEEWRDAVGYGKIRLEEPPPE
jgi:dipeptidase